MPKETIRLDVALQEAGLAETRTKAQALIMAGEVQVNGKLIDKPGTRVHASDQFTLKSKPRFVSRGGEKLDGALTAFAIPVDGRVAADVGASTGGFTDCLLQRGVGKVYAIDVGYGQLDYRVRVDPRVIVMERTNARYLESLPEPVNLVVVDASFISLRLLLPAIQKWLVPPADIVTLVKPQFEAGREEVPKGGIVRQASVHQRVLEKVTAFAEQTGLIVAGVIVSPLKGMDGNTEFLLWLKTEGEAPTAEQIVQWIQDALAAA
ncbi:MAG: TlyA family RNA methyltransferase [Phototrophicaceae bacterium]